MDWQSLIGPAVVAAIISALVAWLTTSRRFALDRELAERKVNADIALAEKKQAADIAVTRWKRHVELAEEVLADFYEAREVLVRVRHPGGFGNEGNSRKTADWETEDDTRVLNGYFVAIERLQKESAFFSRLEARRYRFMAAFGPDAAAPFDQLFGVRGRVLSGARMLLMTYDRQRGRHERSEDWEDQIWATDETNELTLTTNQAVAAIEQTCRRVLDQTP